MLKNNKHKSSNSNKLNYFSIVIIDLLFGIRKDDLKKKLEELSSHYNDSLTTMKEELNKNIAKLIDVEKKYNDEIGNKKQLLKTIESQCARLIEYELRHKDTMKQLQETERTSS